MNTNYIQLVNPTIATGVGYTYSYALAIPEKKNRNIFHKAGRFVGKTFSFFRKSETKTAALISYWAVETVLFAAIMLAATSSFIFFSALFLYLYGTYAIFCAVNALTK